MNALKKLVYRFTPKCIRRVRFFRFRRAWGDHSDVAGGEYYPRREMSDEEFWEEYAEFSRWDAQHYIDLIEEEVAWKRHEERIRQHGQTA